MNEFTSNSFLTSDHQTSFTMLNDRLLVGGVRNVSEYSGDGASRVSSNRIGILRDLQLVANRGS